MTLIISAAREAGMCVGYFMYSGQVMRTLSKELFYSHSYQLGLLHVNLSGYPGSGKFTAQHKGGKNQVLKEIPCVCFAEQFIEELQRLFISFYRQEPASSLCHRLFHTMRWVVLDGGKEKATSQHKTAEYFQMTNGIN